MSVSFSLGLHAIYILFKLTVRLSLCYSFFCFLLSVHLGEFYCAAHCHLFTFLTFALKRILLYILPIPIIWIIH